MDTPLTELAHLTPEPAQQARPRFTLSEAAERTSASRSTLRRRLDEGAFPNASKDDEGVWRIPVEDLLAAGLTMSKPINEPAQPVHAASLGALDEHAHPDRERIQQLEEQVKELQAQPAIERAQRTAAEQVAAERADHLNTARRALRMIEAAPERQPATTPPASNPQKPATPAEETPKQVPLSESPFAPYMALGPEPAPTSPPEPPREAEPKSWFRKMFSG